MWDMTKQAMLRFVQGKLFQDYGMVLRQAALGAAITAALFCGALWAGLPLIAAAAGAGLIGGCLQPRLFRNLKYQ
jgi:hypothetical protein